MQRAGALVAVAVVVLAGCGRGDDDVLGQADGSAPDGPESILGEGVAYSDVGAEIFGIGFEGLWRFDEPTEAAVVVADEATGEEAAAAIADEPGVVEVSEVDDPGADEHGDVDLLVPSGKSATVLRVTAEDQAAAAALAGLTERDDVRYALAPTCDALAGAARHHGAEQARAWLDEAGCDDIAVVDADPDAERPWVAATGAVDDTTCTATATTDAAMTTCDDNPDEASSQLATHVGGFAVGLVPDGADTVVVEHGGETVTAEPVSVAGGQPVFAAPLPAAEPAPEADVIEAPGPAEVTVRFRDADGDVVGQV